MPYCFNNVLCSFISLGSLVRLCVLLALLFSYEYYHLQCQSVRFHVKSWLPARSIVLECLLSRGEVDPSGEIMVLDRFCPVRSWPFFFSVSHQSGILPTSTTEFFLPQFGILREAINVIPVWLLYFIIFHVQNIIVASKRDLENCCTQDKEKDYGFKYLSTTFKLQLAYVCQL